MAAEWLDPRVIKAKVDFENQKNLAELARAGDRVRATALAEKQQAVSGLLPIYQKYRELAVDVINSPMGASSEATGAIVRGISKIPMIGEVGVAGLEAGHAALGSTLDTLGLSSVDPRMKDVGQKIGQLNSITDALAQGMANAVIGNRGPTSENDRRTAKGVLVNSFTGVKSAEEMLKITDRMFMLLPTIAANTPEAPPAAVIQQAFTQAQQEVKSGNTATTAAEPGTPQLTNPGKRRLVMNPDGSFK
jgi:hypothetical protein